MQIIEQTIFPTGELNFNYREIIDADFRDKFGLITLIKVKGNYAVVVNQQLVLSTLSTEYSIIRWINEETFLLVNRRISSHRPNAFVYQINGTLERSFYIGDAVSEVSVAEDQLWVGYFDEGIFGKGMSKEGLVLLNTYGEVLFRYHTDQAYKSEGVLPSIFDCYTLCGGRGTSIWLLPYSEFILLHITLNPLKIELYEVPDDVKGATAISIRGQFGYSFDIADDTKAIKSWKLGEDTAQVIGIMDGDPRGLRNKETNHFISCSSDCVRLYQIMNLKEYSTF